jgi:tetratricopeptide (TPR) repeat protein
MCYRRLGKLDNAMACIEETTRATDLTSPREEVTVLHVWANIYGDLGEIEKQFECYERALEINNRYGLITSHRMIIYSSMIGVLVRLGRFEEALAFERESIDFARRGDVPRDMALVLASHGERLVFLERHEEALPHLLEAIPILERSADIIRCAGAIEALATAYRHLGETTRAVDTWESAASHWMQGGSDARAVLALENAARVARNVPGMEGCAVRAYEQAIAIAKDQEKEADLRNSLAIVFFSQKKYEAALALYEGALAIFTERADLVHRGLVLNSMGATLERLGRIDEAIAILEEGIRVNRESGERLLEGHALAVLGGIHVAKGERDVARSCYERSLELRRSVGDKRGEGWMLRYIGGLETDQTKARSLLETALSLAETDDELSRECKRILEELR